MAAEDIRLIVERCYAIPPGLTANPLDQLNPSIPNAAPSSGPVAAEVDPSAVIRDLVGRCYSLPPELGPNPLDQVYVPTPPSPPVIEPPPSPGQVIRELVERCYPDLPEILPPPEFPTGLGDPVRIEEPPWLPWLIDLTGAPCSPFFCFPITIDPPTPPFKPPTLIHGPGPDDCDMVAKFLAVDKLRDLPDYEEVRDGKLLKSPGWWEHIETGEKYYCDISQKIDIEWNNCVRNAMECMFRPYFGGRWQPPRADCSAYWPKGWSGNLTEICVENCYPDRLPVYESYLSSGTLNVTFDSVGNLVATGSGTALVVLKLQWNDRVNTYGTAVSTISLDGVTWTQTGRSGEEIHTLNLTQPGTTQISFTGLNAANSPLVILDNNTRLCLKDGGGSDCNANFSIVSVNLGADHAYDPNGAKSGYTLTNSKPGFYILKDPIIGVTVPLFRFYSTLKTDTFLTTNPGQPDSVGVGERPMMNADGHAGGEVLGHVFPTALAMNSYLAPGEQAEPLHRFHSPNPYDHKYSIDGDYAGGMPVKVPDHFCYRIPLDAKADLNIQMDVEKGDSGYNNSLGFYLADDTGPKYGRVVVTSARNGTEMYNAYVPNAKLAQYAGGTMGFFLISDGADVNTLTANQDIAFEPLNSPHLGGFRGTGINSAQSNYCLFSDNRWNPKDKDQTKWHGKDIQFWEDLIDGDDDYNDLRLWHKLGYTFGGYVYEGVQCYAYAEAAPEKVMRKVNPDVECDTRILKASFKDVMVRRMDCGIKLPTFQSNDVAWECSTCQGAYAIELNRTQTIEAAVGGTFRVCSMGGITGGIMGSCMKFTLRVSKNGVALQTKQWEAQYWPKIGGDLFSGNISIVPTDTLTFEVVSIDSGAVTGDIALEVALFDMDSNMFDGVFKLMLGTQSHDDVIAQTTGNPTLNPEVVEGGEVEGFAFSFNPTNRREFEWEPGCIYGDTMAAPLTWSAGTQYEKGQRVYYIDNVTDPQNPVTYGPFQAANTIGAGLTPPTHNTGTNAQGWHFIRGIDAVWPEDNVPDPGFPYTYVWKENLPVRMHGSLQPVPQLPGSSRIINNSLIPYITGGYIDTGYLYEKDEYYSATILESYNYRNLSGVYNHLVEDFLFTRFERLSGTTITQAQNDVLVEAAPTTFARGSKPWYMLGSRAENNWYINPATLAWRITQGATEIATSLIKKGTWVATGASNNPSNGWTQFMKSYGIYKTLPTDNQVDPYIDTWQIHTTTVVFPSSTSYSMKIQSDNWGWIKITNPSGTVIMDREISYVNGAGDETIPLTLASGTYTIETRVKNADVGNYQGVVDAIWNGSKATVPRDTYYSPVTFIHDYTLDNYHGTGGSNYANAAKIRCGITFYPVIFDGTTSSKQVHYWQAMVHVIDVIDKGKGYTKASEFVLTWPPMRDRAVEDPTQTPYYPDQETGFKIPSGKQLAWWENEDLVRRSLKEAFYQESHNKDSVVWYSATDKQKFRVRFKITLEDVTDQP